MGDADDFVSPRVCMRILKPLQFQTRAQALRCGVSTTFGNGAYRRRNALRLLRPTIKILGANMTAAKCSKNNAHKRHESYDRALFQQNTKAAS
jgi:hypothetical protein